MLMPGLVWEQACARTSQTLVKYVATVHPDRSSTGCLSVVGEPEPKMREPPTASGGGTLEQGKTDAET